MAVGSKGVKGATIAVEKSEPVTSGIAEEEQDRVASFEG